MGMVVRSNVMSMNANRSLGINNTNVGKSLEKLSSGFRINRAADDASGLAISEKMKAQIKGLEQASSNSQDGISLIQTAEGGTQEIHNMLNRMTELATKSANGTIQNDVDRDAIQNEVNDLKKEITRIAETTKFNGLSLLEGTQAAATGKTLTEGTATVAGKFEFTLSNFANIKEGDTIKIGDASIEIVAGSTSAAGKLAVADKASATDWATALGSDFVATTATATKVGVVVSGGKLTFSGVASATGASKFNGVFDKNTSVTSSFAGISMQVGDTNDKTNHVSVTVDDLTAKGLGIDALDVDDQESAGKSIQTIKDAINKVSTNRANLGSLQNRLEYTINNLDTASENMTAANSRIRDTDMAKEMMNYTKNNILTQAAQAMLAQANQAPQAILQLLQ